MINDNSSGPITGERVRLAMIAAGIERIDHHRCSLCGYMTAYLRRGDDLYFDAGCDCSGRRRIEPRDWDSAAEWVEMQSAPENRARLLDAFGLTGQDNPS